MGGSVGLQLVDPPSAQAFSPFPIIDKPPATITAGAPNTNWLAAGTWQTNTLNPAVENNAGSQINSSLGPQVVGTYTSDGWTRLTDNTPAGGVRSHQAANILNSTPFPASAGFEAIFDYRQAGGYPLTSPARTADGIAMYLVDATKATTTSGSVTSIASVGAPGNGLGYAATTDSQPETPDGSGNYPAGMCGITGGYLGLGFDVFGNFASSSKGNYGGSTALNSSGNYIGLRGSAPATCTLATLKAPTSTYWPWIGGNQTSDKSPIWTGLSASSRSDPAKDTAGYQYRRVWVEVIPSGTGTNTSVTVNVYMSPLTFVPPSTASNATPTPTTRTLEFTATATPADGLGALPTNLMIGFSASTGGASDYHDIRNVSVTELGDAAIEKTVTGGRPGYTTPTFGVGDSIGFTLTAANLGPTAIGDAPTGVAVVHDDLSGLPITNVTWTCNAYGGAACVGSDGSSSTTSSGTGSVINQRWTAPVTADPTNDPYGGARVEITVSGKVTAPAGTATAFENTAVIPTNFTDYTVDDTSTSIQMDGGLSDTNLTNNTATAAFDIVKSPLLTQTKTADKSQYWVGDPITYTIRVDNTGDATGTANVTDAVPTGIMVNANGATCVADATAACTAGTSGNNVSGTVTLPANTGATFTVKGVVTAAGTFTNTSHVSVTTTGCTQALCGAPDAEATVTATAPLWTVEKSTPDLVSDFVSPGDTVNYQVTATSVTTANGSAAAVSNVVLSDDLSGVLGSATFVPGSAQLVITGSAVPIVEPDPVGTTLKTAPFTLPAGGTAVLTYQVTVKADAWLATLANAVTGTGSVPPEDCEGACQTVTYTSGQLFVNKISPSGTLLPGAAFQISSDAGGSPGTVLAGLPVVPVTDQTGESQTGEFSVDGILPGTYWLTETTAPSGYLLLASPVSFRISPTGAVTLVNPAADAAVASVAGNTLTVTDRRPPVVLPNAGGTRPFPVSGLGLLILAGLAATAGVIWLKRQRV